MAEILTGKPVAAAITENLTARARVLTERGVEPCLAIVRVGEDGGAVSYERNAIKRCEKIGIKVKSIVLPERSTQDEVLAVIDGINADDGIHGCLMFRPLPRMLMEREICERLKPEKDVDCMTGASLATVFSGSGAGFAPCTAQSCVEILEHYGVELEGKNVAVIGRSLVIGRPVSMLLQARNATVTMCHSGTADLPDVCRRADIIIAAVGRAGMVDESFVRPGQVVIDVGINVTENGICGDVSFDSVAEKVAAITPVPGGVGSVTTAVLCKHVIEAAERL